MASIILPAGHKNLRFAAQVEHDTGARFKEDGDRIIIDDSPTLEIARHSFNRVFAPDYKDRKDGQLESAWASLILNKTGYLVHFGEDGIVLSDTEPTEDGKPAYLLKFDSTEQKAIAEARAARWWFRSLKDFILASMEAYEPGEEGRDDSDRAPKLR
jgi:hypothetical protein